MPANPPTLYIIAGCNGAGKTTFATEFLPHSVHCLRFLNPDEIARGLSPLDPPAANVKAARILLQEIHVAIRRRETFAMETTLSGRTYIHLLKNARANGYEIELHYLWLASPRQAIARVRQRVQKGGHARTSVAVLGAAWIVSCMIIFLLPIAGSFGTTGCRRRAKSQTPRRNQSKSLKYYCVDEQDSAQIATTDKARATAFC